MLYYALEMLLRFQNSMLTLHGLIYRLKSSKDTVSQNTQHDMKVLFSSFPKNGDTAWFDPQTKRLQPD